MDERRNVCLSYLQKNKTFKKVANKGKVITWELNVEHSEYIIIHIFTSNEMSLFYGYSEYVNCVCVCIYMYCKRQANRKTKPIVAMLLFNKK